MPTAGDPAQPAALPVVRSRALGAITAWRLGTGFSGMYAAVLLGSLTVALVGFLRESMIARTFGTSATADGIAVAVALPQFLQMLLVGSIVNGSGMRRLAEVGSRHHKTQVGLALALAGLGIIVPVLVLSFASPLLLVHLLAPSASGGALSTASSLLPFVAASGAVLYSASIITAMLNLRGYARFTTFAQAVPALCIAGSLLALHSVGATAYGIGALGGAMLLVLLSSQRLLSGVSLPPIRIHLAGAGVIKTEVARLLGPSAALMGAAVLGQVLAVIERSVALGSQTGTLAAISYAIRVTGVPLVLFNGLLSSIIFVRLARASDADFGPYLLRVVGVIALCITFLAALLFVNAAFVVDVIFRHGAFNAGSAATTVLFLRLYCLAIPLQLIGPLLAFALYARGRGTTVAAITGVTVVINSAVLLGLSSFIGSPAIPIALIAVSILTVVLESVALRRELRRVPNVLQRLLVPALYLVACVLVCAAMAGPLQGIFAHGFIGVLASGLILGGLATAAFGVQNRVGPPATLDIPIQS